MTTHMVTFPKNGGIQTIYRFDNGYGASIVNHRDSYGTELAVIKFHGSSIEDFDLCYDTHITNDVLGHLTPANVDKYLQMIAELPESI